MVENLVSSTLTGKLRTGKTVSLTPAQALEILQAAAAKCQQVGLSVKVAPLYGSAPPGVAIVLANVDFIDGNLVLVGEANDGTQET